MGRLLLLLLLVAGLVPCPGQLREREEKPIELPENMKDEDEDVLNEPEYVFNPIQAAKDVKIGDFYAKKGNHRAAAGRYLEATKWNPRYAEAFWKLGRSKEKLEQWEDALEAYRRFLSLEPDKKEAKKVEKKLAVLKRKAQTNPRPEEKP